MACGTRLSPGPGAGRCPHPIRDRTGPSRLLDTVEGRSKQVFKTWLAQRPEAWRKGLEVVAMDGFMGFKTATAWAHAQRGGAARRGRGDGSVPCRSPRR